MNYVVKKLSAGFKDRVTGFSSEVFDTFLEFENSSSDRAVKSDKFDKLYKSNKPKWLVNYDVVRYLPQVYQIAFSEDILDAVKQFGIKRPIFSASIIPLRIDMPFDEQFAFPWHQDFAYNLGSENSVTVWIPLQDTQRENGALEVIEGDYLSYNREKRLLKSTDDNGVLEADTLHDLMSDPSSEHKIVPVDVGEILIFSQFLVHRSGKNISKFPRMSLQVRFSDLSDQFFKDKKYSFSKTNTVPKYSDVIDYLS
tara:strand:+ start:301 stop:1062 length:762 start_codon:yes stop_codon:yes gene_type:complete